MARPSCLQCLLILHAMHVRVSLLCQDGLPRTGGSWPRSWCQSVTPMWPTNKTSARLPSGYIALAMWSSHAVMEGVAWGCCTERWLSCASSVRSSVRLPRPGERGPYSWRPLVVMTLPSDSMSTRRLLTSPSAAAQSDPLIGGIVSLQLQDTKCQPSSHGSVVLFHVVRSPCAGTRDLTWATLHGNCRMQMPSHYNADLLC